MEVPGYRAGRIGVVSPSGTATVIMKEVTPDPLPICLSPVRRQAPSLPFSAVARVAIRSPPPPGSDEMVPNQCPAFAAVSTRSRCSRQAFGSTGGSTGSSSHRASRVGWMVATNATEGSTRRRSEISHRSGALTALRSATPLPSPPARRSGSGRPPAASQNRPCRARSVQPCRQFGRPSGCDRLDIFLDQGDVHISIPRLRPSS